MSGDFENRCLKNLFLILAISRIEKPRENPNRYLIKRILVLVFIIEKCMEKI